MGQCCTTAPNEQKDQIQLQKEIYKPMNPESEHQEENIIVAIHKQELNLNKNLSDSQTSENQIRELKEQKFQQDYHHKQEKLEKSEQNNPHAPQPSVAIPVQHFPNFQNEKGKKTLIEQGEFIFDEDEQGNSNLPKLGPYQFENGSIYIGQWKEGQRHGHGTQYWSDGSIYEGYWRN
ncbi:p38 protein, putative, partial [Ichthyophthirius multifiliis]